MQIIGVSRSDVDITTFVPPELQSVTTVYSMDLAKKGDYDGLREYIALAPDEQLLVYLSVPPRASTQIVDFLGEAGLNSPQVKVLFEKPFGVDLPSAREMIAQTARYYDESQIYRIDHYLAKEMAQNIVAMRGGNALLTNIWDNRSIEKIEIVATETIGIEGRGQFYEQTGALRDVLQGHLMQLLALVLMDIPAAFDWERMPALRTQALAAVKPAEYAKSRRAQYEGYAEEAENLGSTVETYVSVQLRSEAPQWQGVPIVLVTGKAMQVKTTEIRVYLRRDHDAQSNCIVFHIQPDEGVEIELYVKKPGYDREFERQRLDYAYPPDAALPDAYEQVLADAIRSRRSLFASGEEVLRSWEILQPILDGWAMESGGMRIYTKNSVTHL
jgi:glucose-6-phosphate 1-dehydrogenase